MDRTIVAILTVLLLLLGFVSQAEGQQGNTSLENLLISAEKADMNQNKLNNITSRAEAKGISGRQLYDILAPAVAMAEQDLPYETALDKALEGLSKGVSTERIAFQPKKRLKLYKPGLMNNHLPKFQIVQNRFYRMETIKTSW